MKRFLSYVLTALLTCAITLGGVYLYTENDQEYSKLQQLQSIIDAYFVEDTDKNKLEDAAANAIVGALGDRWSYYMTAEDYQSYLETMNNAYVGVGMTVQVNPDGLGIDVVQVTEGGPAEAAGMKYGDIVIAVDGESIAEMELTQITTMVKGTAGTFVELTVLRNDQELKVSVERKQIQTPVATAQMLPDNIGLVTIVNFDSRCYEETVAAIEALLDQGAESLIFDVRFNPGGYKKQLVDVLDYLLPEGDVFKSVSYDGKESVDKSDAKCLQMPMAVLVNGSSYSAAEFFAAALREYEWATVVGTQTCGKGYFQNCFQLDDGSAVNISIGKYYTPKGVSLAEAGGLVPDVVVEVDDEINAAIYADKLDPMEDPQILAAIEALQGK